MRDFLNGFFKSSLVLSCLLGSLLCVQQALADDPNGLAGFCQEIKRNGVWTGECGPNRCPWNLPVCAPSNNNNACTCRT